MSACASRTSTLIWPALTLLIAAATAHAVMESLELVAAYDAKLRPALLSLEDRRLPLTGQILEVVRVE